MPKAAKKKILSEEDLAKFHQLLQELGQTHPEVAEIFRQFIDREEMSEETRLKGHEAKRIFLLTNQDWHRRFAELWKQIEGQQQKSE